MLILGEAACVARGLTRLERVHVPLVIANEGKEEMLGLTLIETTIVDAYYNLFLFVNNYTPVANMTTASFTKPGWTGYADVVMLRSQWQTPTFGTGKGQVLYGSPLPDWTVGPQGGTVYGYGVQSILSGLMLWAEAFAQPRTLGAGDILTVQCQFTDDTDPNPL